MCLNKQKFRGSQWLHLNFVLPPLPLASTSICDCASSCKLSGAAIGPSASQFASRSLVCLPVGMRYMAVTVY